AGESDSGLDPTEGQDQVPETCGPLNNSYYEPLSNECFCDASYEWCYPNDLYNYECCIHCDSSNTPEQLLVQEGGTCYPDLKLDHCSNRGAKDNACGLYESVYFVCLPNEEQPATGPRKGKWVLPATNNFGCELRGFTKYNGCY